MFESLNEAKMCCVSIWQEWSPLPQWHSPFSSGRTEGWLGIMEEDSNEEIRDEKDEKEKEGQG